LRRRRAQRDDVLIDGTIVAVALPTLMRDLGTSISLIGWTLTAYQLAQTVMSIFPVGGIVGPNVGGFIIQHASWRDIFFINLPIGFVVIAVLLRRLRLPEAMTRRPLDFLGAGIF